LDTEKLKKEIEYLKKEIADKQRKLMAKEGQLRFAFLVEELKKGGLSEEKAKMVAKGVSECNVKYKHEPLRMFQCMKEHIKE